MHRSRADEASLAHHQVTTMYMRTSSSRNKVNKILVRSADADMNRE
jgi:hypothetical protein